MWITDGLYLTYEQALNNANIVFNFFKDKGYTKEAICGLLGNMWRESHVNPSLHEVGGTGYGLTQWTPKDKLLTRLALLALADNGDNQLKVLERELTDGANNSSSNFSQWYDVGEWTLAKFKTSKDIHYTTECFMRAYERPGVLHLEERIEYANKFYRDITGEVNGEGIQLAVLPCHGTVTITQAEGGDFSHDGTLSVDFAYPQTKVPLYSPFDMTCMGVDVVNAFTVWQSDREVKCADGSVSFVTFNTGHSDDTATNSVGKKRKKGEIYAYTGVSGNVTGDHTHIEGSKAKFTTMWQNGSLPNPSHLYDIFSSCNNVTKEEIVIINNTSTPMPFKCILDWNDGLGGSGGGSENNVENLLIKLWLCDALNGWKY